MERQKPTRRRTFVLPLIVALFAQTLLAPVRAAGHNFLWKATGRGGVVYLVGSVHLLSQDYYPLNPALDSSFKDSDLLVEEVDLERDAGARVAAVDPHARHAACGPVARQGPVAGDLRARHQVGQRSRRADRGAAAVQAVDARDRAGRARAGRQGGFDPNLGLDKHFYDLAQAGGKQIQGLETAAYQMSRFDDMTMAQQDQLLADTLKELDTEQTSVNKLADAWKSGDAPTVEQIVLKDLKSDPVMYQRLLVERNRNWLPKLDALFSRPGHAFVVVGAAHLVGPTACCRCFRRRATRSSRCENRASVSQNLFERDTGRFGPDYGSTPTSHLRRTSASTFACDSVQPSETSASPRDTACATYRW